MLLEKTNTGRLALRASTNKILGWIYRVGFLYGAALIPIFYFTGLDDPARYLRLVLISLICAWGSWQSQIKGDLELPFLAGVILFIAFHPFTAVEGQIFGSIIQCLFILLAYNIQTYHRARITAGLILVSLAATPLHQSELPTNLYAQMVACVFFGAFIVDRSAKNLLKIADETDASHMKAQALIEQAAMYEAARTHAQNSFSSLLTSLPTPFSAHRSDGTPHIISDAFWDTLKVPEYARQANQWRDLLPTESKAQLRSLLNASKNSSHPVMSEKPILFTFRRTNFSMSACASRTPSHEGELILISFHDITQHQEMNESLARSNQLARASAAEALTKNNELLEAQSKIKEMISSTSHELRTPLSLMHMILGSNKHLTAAGEQQLSTAVSDAISTLDNLSLLNRSNQDKQAR